MFALLPASASAAGTTRIIVKREPGLSSAEQQDVRAAAGAKLVERLSVPRLEVVTVPSAEAGAALAQLNRDPDVAFAEVDGLVHAFDHGQPDSQMYRMWGLVNAGEPGQDARAFDAAGKLVDTPAAYDADMDVLEAWGLSQGAGRLVAVVDGGVHATHHDLANRIAPGYDWVDEDTNADDPRGHGTQVAGIVAADANNGIGGAGVAPKARILPLRVLDENGSGRVSDIVEAFHFAGQQHVRIVNASFGAGTYDKLEYDEIAKWPGTLFVTAAGNAGGNDDVAAQAKYPCAFDLANVVCVGASNARDERASWSNYGLKSVDVFAPGEGIFAPYVPGLDDYAYSSGTSMAAPHVAGLAALLLARNPRLTTAQIKEAIVKTADVKPGLTSVSRGRANAAAALAYWPADRDGDQVVDDQDNCPNVANADQSDADLDGVGDACADGAAAPDSDGDTVTDDADQCPRESGPVGSGGCPGLAADANHDGLLDIFDTDGDHVSNHKDNCPGTVTTNVVDSDHDGVGNACDSTPRGPDADHDGKPLLDDACPAVYGTQPNGCPAAVKAPPPDADHDGRPDASDRCRTEPAATADGCPLPSLTAFSTKVRRRAATIAVRTSRAATVQITVQRKRGHRWVRVTRRTSLSSANRVTLKLKHLRPGRYRALVLVSSTAGRAPTATRRFRVR